MYYINILLLLTLLTTFIRFLLHYEKFLLTLLSIEAIILNVIFYITFKSIIIEIYNPLIRIVILTIGACEARVGLSLIVKISRNCGRDQINILNLSKC